tara:strand:- start:201 stop:596 length:396 start_codon:yes stop_codon:yes gene_type:complete
MKKFDIQTWQTKHILNETEDERFNDDTKTVSGLADKFLDVSKRMRKGEYKGLQSGEINEIDDLLAMVLQAAMDGNITAVIIRLEGMLAKSIKEPAEKDPSSSDDDWESNIIRGDKKDDDDYWSDDIDEEVI